ncbi:MAG: hypothetical protein WAT92_02845 [Saprospiraceae bacterium]
MKNLKLLFSTVGLIALFGFSIKNEDLQEVTIINNTSNVFREIEILNLESLEITKLTYKLKLNVEGKNVFSFISRDGAIYLVETIEKGQLVINEENEISGTCFSESDEPEFTDQIISVEEEDTDNKGGIIYYNFINQSEHTVITYYIKPHMVGEFEKCAQIIETKIIKSNGNSKIVSQADGLFKKAPDLTKVDIKLLLLDKKGKKKYAVIEGVDIEDAEIIFKGSLK